MSDLDDLLARLERDGRSYTRRDQRGGSVVSWQTEPAGTAHAIFNATGTYRGVERE